MTIPENSGAPETQINLEKHITRVSLVRIVIVLAAYWILFSVFPVAAAWEWQVSVFAGALAFLGLSAVGATLMARLGYAERALVISVAVLNINLLVMSLAVQGLGVILALVLILTVGSLVSATRTKISSLALSVSLVTSATIVLADIFLRNTAWRFDLSNDPIIVRFGWLLTLVILIANVFFFYRQFLNFPLRIKIAISFLMVTITSLWGLSYINNRTTQILLTSQAQGSLEGTARQIHSNINTFLDSGQSSIANEAQLPVFTQYLTNTSNPIYKSQALETLHVLRGRDTAYIHSVAIANSNGLIILSTTSAEIGTHIEEEVYFSHTVSENTAVISPVLYYTLDDARIYFTAPLVTESGLGALIVVYDAEKLQTLLEPANNAIGDVSFAVLFDENLIHIAHSAAPEVNYKSVTPFDQNTYNRLLAEHRIPAGDTSNTLLNLPSLAENLAAVQSSNDSTIFFTAKDIATGDLINEVVAIEIEQDWILAFFQPREIFLAPAENQFRANALISVLITAIVAMVALGLSQILTNPISELTDAAKRIVAGDFSARTEIQAKDEFGLLATTFNDMSEQLETLITGLESQVGERTSALENNAKRLRMAAEIARDTSMETDADLLLQRAVDLIEDRLDLYFVGIYLLDEKKSFGKLVAGSGESAQMLVESDHRASLRSATPLSFTLTTGEPRLVREDDLTLNLIRHPVLPNLREQLVLPLKIGYDIIGAIDLQSDEIGSLSEVDIPVLVIMADQIAVSIQRGQLAKDMENTLEELETAYGRYTKDAWREFGTEQDKVGYRFQQVGIEPVQDTPSAVSFVWDEGEIVQHETDYESSLLVPMKVRGQVISVLNLKFDSDTIPHDTQMLVEEIGQRLSLVMENARLVETSQKRVEQEQLTSQITARMRESLDMDTILRISVEEISKALNIPEIEIQLGRGSTSSSNGNK